jgi:tRNA threonylcarbamoyladenosine biosynthesis protein TsaB
LSWLLALDGALGPFSVALVSPDGAVVRTASTTGNSGLERGLTLIEELLAGEPLERVGKLAVSTGPGGYTGLRIALSFAKGLAFARGLPLIAVSSYDVLEPPGALEPVAAFVTGRTGTICARLRYEGAASVDCGADAEVAEALAARLPAGTFLECAGAWQGAAPRLGERAITVRPCPPFESPPALAVARRALWREPAASPHAVRADYGAS